MANFGDMVQKAFYLGVGFASYAGEKATEKLADLREQAQKLADEMVARGEITAEEGRKFVDDWVQKAQQQVPQTAQHPTEPRRIEIIEDDEDPAPSAGDEETETLQRQVHELQEELRRLREE